MAIGKMISPEPASDEENGDGGCLYSISLREWSCRLYSLGRPSSAFSLKYAAQFSRKARFSVLSGVSKRPRVVHKRKKFRKKRKYLVIQVKMYKMQ
jgi:hypothetical protein